MKTFATAWMVVCLGVFALVLCLAALGIGELAAGGVRSAPVAVRVETAAREAVRLGPVVIAPVWTATPTPTETWTPTPIDTPTLTPTDTPTGTPTETPTPTETWTPTWTPGVPPEVQIYAVAVLPYIKSIIEAVDGLSELFETPQIGDDNWTIRVAAGLVLIRVSFDGLTAISAPPAMAGVHGNLLTEVSLCNDTTYLLASGVDNRDATTINQAVELIDECGRYMSMAAEKIETPTPIDTPTATPTDTPTGTPMPSPVPTATATWTPIPRATGEGGSNLQPFVCTNGCATPPDPSCAIKGNVNSSGEHIYHLPGGQFYEKTDIKPEEGDRWFCTPGEAEAAGFRRSER